MLVPEPRGRDEDVFITCLVSLFEKEKKKRKRKKKS
jgi:hypothetical protein